MTRRLLTAAVSVTLGLSASAAFAQSYTAPAGVPAAVAPGGLEGRAGARNLDDLRGGRDSFLASRADRGEIATGSVRSHRDDRR